MALSWGIRMAASAMLRLEMSESHPNRIVEVSTGDRPKWRSLRFRVAGFVVAATVGITIALWMLAVLVVEKGFAETESRFHDRNLRQINTLMESDLQALRNRLRTSVSPGFVQSVVGLNPPDYMATVNLQSEVASMTVDFAAVVNERGELKWTYVAQQADGGWELDAGLLSNLSALGTVSVPRPFASTQAEFSSTPFGPAMTASRVFRPNADEPPVGMMVVGKLIGRDYQETLSHRLGVPVLVGSNPTMPELPPTASDEPRVFRDTLRPYATARIWLYSDNEAWATTEFPDAEGNTCVVAVAPLPRDIWMQGKSTTRLLLWLSVAVCAALGVLSVLWLEVSVVGRIRRLSTGAAGIDYQPGSLRYLAVEDRDEFGQLTAAINEMLTRLAESFHATETSEQQLRDAQALAGIGSWVFHPARNEWQWSREMHRMAGLRPGESPVPLDALVDSQGGAREFLATRLAAADPSSPPFELEARLLSRDGSYPLIIAIRGRVQRDAESGEVSVTGTVQDVTAWRMLEANTRELQEQLAHAQKLEALGTLASGVAHELNNTLQPVSVYSGKLLETPDLNGTAKGHAEKIQGAAARAASLVSRILQYGRRQRPETKLVDIGKLAEEVGTLARLAARGPVTLSADVRPDSRGLCVLGDPEQLHTVLMNLCLNGIHAMRQTGGSLSLTVSATEFAGDAVAIAASQGFRIPGRLSVVPGKYVRIEITDTGTGIEDAVVQRMFDPYFTTKPKGEGTGLGLSLVASVVASHGGLIMLRTKVGKGTTFCVLLPRADAVVEAETPRIAGDSVPTPAVDTPSGAIRVLYVDDEEDLRSIVGELLPGDGIEVATAASAAQAKEMLAVGASAFHVVVTDQMMPGMLGTQLAAWIRKEHPEIAVIVSTGNVAEIAAECSQIGVAHCLQKPFRLEALAELVRQAAGSRTG